MYYYHYYSIALLIVFCLFPQMTRAAGITFDTFGVPESIVQYAEQELAVISDKNSLKADEVKLQNTGESGKLQKENVKEPKTTMKDTDTAPFTSLALEAELKKKNPSIPKVEDIFKKEFYIDSKTLYQTNNQSQNIKEQNVTKNSLEQFQMQSHLSFENARALALKALEITDTQDQEFQELRKDLSERNSTTDIKKFISILTYKSNAILNEIAILRNSYLEIKSLNALQGVEKTSIKNTSGTTRNTEKSVTGL